jgi:hypothetical protein
MVLSLLSPAGLVVGSPPAGPRRRWSGFVLAVTCLLGSCDAPPDANQPDESSSTSDVPAQVAVAPAPPAWLHMRPNYGVEESSRLAIEAMEACARQFPLDDLRARLDSVGRLYGVEGAETRSHPDAARHLDALLERQRERQGCTTSSSQYVRSREIVARAPNEFVLPLYGEPDSMSAGMGTIRITRVDVAGPEVFTFGYGPPGEPETEWVTDQMPVDVIYGGYYHTALEHRGDWVRLPAGPFPTPVWIDWRATFHSPPEVETIFGEVYMPGAVEAELAGLEVPTPWEAPGVIYVRAQGDRIWFRLEGPDDGPCPGASPPQDPIQPSVDAEREFSLGIEEIVDDRGHLLPRVKYARGC